MISILLTILKVIGIVLLGILGLVLLLFCLILFVPIRYKLVIDKPEDEGFDIKVQGTVSFLLHLLNAHINYPYEEIFYVRILLFKIFPKRPGRRSLWSRLFKSNKAREESTPEDASLNEASDSILTSELSEDEESIARANEFIEAAGAEFVEIEGCDSTKEEPSIKDLLKRIVDFACNLKERLKKLLVSIKKFKDDIGYYLKVIGSNEFAHSLQKCKKGLGRIIKSIFPKSVKGYFHFGGEEPSTTAQVFGLYSVLNSRALRGFKFYPYLQESRCNGHVVIRGYIQVITIICVGISIYFNKDIKKTLKMLKREEG